MQSGGGNAALLAAPDSADAAAARSLEELQRRGRYVLLGRLGSGGMGVVHAAYDPVLDRKVALKLLRPGEGGNVDSVARGRLLREARALARLSHPNVVHVYEVGTVEDKQVYIAMEHIEGQTLRAWQKEARRPFREVLARYRAAGRGLQAAHEAGLVHRDFKPDNVILGKDGRVVVLDFGLAVAPEAPASGSEAVPTLPANASSDTTPTAELPSDADESTVSTVSTAPAIGPPRPVDDPASDAPLDGSNPAVPLGARPLDRYTVDIIGTRPYMAPEQHVGRAIDARTDQYSFCLALYEGLYGQRPFLDARPFGEIDASTVSAEGSGEGEPARQSWLVRQKFRRRVQPPPPDSDVPGWLRQIVLRGLSADPAERWPSMTALLSELSRDPAARRRRWVAIAGAVAIAAALVVMYSRVRHERSLLCQGAEQKLHGVWDADRRTQMRGSFEATGSSADATFTRVAHTLDGYAGRWVDMHTSACEAARVRGEQSEELLDLRMQCLAERLDALRATVDVLAVADATVVAKASSAATALPPLDDCGNLVLLRALVRPPADPTTRDHLVGLRRRLAEARAQSNVGKVSQALAGANGVAGEARALGYRPFEASVLIALSQIRQRAGDWQGALDAARDGMRAADAGHDGAQAAEAQSYSTFLLGTRLGRPAEAEAAARDTEARLEGLAELDPRRRLNILKFCAAGFMSAGKSTEARSRYLTALALLDQLRVPAAARAADGEASAGDGQPPSRNAINDDDSAIRGGLLSHLAWINAQVGLFASALGQFEQAVAAYTQAFGEGNPDVALFTLDVGVMQYLLGHEHEAAVALERARSLIDRFSPDNPIKVTALDYLGFVMLRRGEAARARPLFQQALEIIEHTKLADHPALPITLLGLARQQLQESPAAGAAGARDVVTMLERAVGVGERTHADPWELAWVRFELVRALSGQSADPGRIQRLVDQIKETYAHVPELAGPERSDFEAWLAHHP